MKRITVTRPDGVICDPYFDTQADADAWKANQIAKGRFSQEDITYEGNTPYEEDRENEYRKLDSTLSEALVEKELGDSTKWDAYIILRDAIKAAHPKP